MEPVKIHAIVAHRPTGQLRTVSQDEADRLLASSEWIIVCRETDDMQPAPSKAASPVAFTVKVAYLHHTKPHHSDTPERRAEKARTSESASKHECTNNWEHPDPIAAWTVGTLTQVIDTVRSNMPTAAPAGEPCSSVVYRGDPS